MSITQEEYEKVTSKVLGESKKYEGDPCIGYDFEKGVDFDELMKAMKTTGFQAMNLSKVIDQINEMRKNDALIYLGCSSNIVSCGLREVVRYLVKHLLSQPEELRKISSRQCIQHFLAISISKERSCIQMDIIELEISFFQTRITVNLKTG